MAVNREVIEAWADAIESQRYPHGTAFLNVGGCLCYNGVLCELAAEAGVVKRYTRDYGDLIAYGEDQETGFLPEEVVAWAGLRSCNPSVDGLSIITHNDALHTPPQEMAKLIREAYL